jgi:hypothetical protein
VEPDVRPLVYAASAFIADKARRLSIPLADGVSPLHLLSESRLEGGEYGESEIYKLKHNYKPG